MRRLRRPAALPLRRLVGRVRSVDSKAAATSGERVRRMAELFGDDWRPVMLRSAHPIEMGAVVGEQTHHHVIIIGAGFAGLGMASNSSSTA